MMFTHVKELRMAHIELKPDEWHWSRPTRWWRRSSRSGSCWWWLGDARTGRTPTSGANLQFVDAPPAPEFMDEWGEFCGAVAGRYPGRIAAYQIWNEPNLSREWGNSAPDPAGYVELLHVCSEAIRAADPDAILISAGLAPTASNDLAHPMTSISGLYGPVSNGTSMWWHPCARFLRPDTARTTPSGWARALGHLPPRRGFVRSWSPMEHPA
jgi:hypothetical protein